MTDLTKYVRRYTTISAMIDILQRKELPLLDPQTWDDRNDRYFMELYKQSRKIGGLYGLCAARCSETYHHWRVFTGSSDGACIEINRARLEATLGEIEGVRYGAVEYLKLAEVEGLTPRDLTRLPFLKREGFAAEKEYRIIAETARDQEHALSIEFPLSMINRISVNPWLPKTLADSLRSTLRSIPGCSELNITRSQLIDSGRWKSAGDSVAGRRPTKKLVLKRTPGSPPRA